MSTSALPLLHIDNLRTYIHTQQGVVHAVDGVSLELNIGQTLAIVGESGCGKSVLCRSIMGLLPENAHIDPGSALQFEGMQLIGLPEKQYNSLRATQMAMVFQDSIASLHPLIPVGQQISESIRCHDRKSGQQARQQALELINDVGLPWPEKCSKLLPHQLSGGMRQRIAIAIALACNPQLLIADEPTTALDVTVQAGVLALLGKFLASREMSVLMVTHDFGVARSIADKIAVMYAGKIVELAKTSQLFHAPGHHYTRALIAAIPQINQSPDIPLKTIEGQPCALLDPPKGCRFSARCPQAQAICQVREPVLKAHRDSHHLLACWFPDQGPSL